MKPIVILVTLVLIAIPKTALGGGIGIPIAPVCESSFDFNWSVSKANTALSGAAGLGGGPLVYPALGKAKDLLHTAANNIEQVLNYGVYGPTPGPASKCMTCNPIPRLLPAATRLGNLRKAATGDPRYNDGESMADTINRNLQADDYCGAFANRVDIIDVQGKWEFGRVGGPVLCPATIFTLTSQKTDHGRKIAGCHPNESYYWRFSTTLVFVDGGGRIRSVLRRQNDDYWKGPFRKFPGETFPSGIIHYIKRVKTTPIPSISTTPPPAPPGWGMLSGVNRRGCDLGGKIILPQPRWELCRDKCAGNPKCKAWTYVKPNSGLPGHGSSPECWLKNCVPPGTFESCCVSGVRPGVPLPPTTASPKLPPWYVFYRQGEFTCCRDPKTGWTPHPVHLNQSLPADHVKLGGPFSTLKAAREWMCNRPVYDHAWASNRAYFNGKEFTSLPGCKVNQP